MNKNVSKLLGSLLAGSLLLGAANARANFGGKVFCDANCDGVYNGSETGISGLTINVYRCTSGALVASTITDANGIFTFGNPPVTPYDSYYLCLASIPAGMTVSPQLPVILTQTNNTASASGCTPCFFWNIDGDYWDNNFGLCSSTGTCAPPPPPPGPCPPANPIFGLGAAGGFTVLGLTGAYVVISEGATLVRGNVGLGPNDTGDLLKATIDGTLILDPTSNPNIHPDLTVTGGIISMNLTPAVNAALAANANLTALAPSQSYGDITKTFTFNGSGSLNVISLKSVNLVKGTITLTGGPSDVFIFNVAGQFNFSSSQVKLVGVSPSNIIWNFPVSGSGDVNIFKDVTIAYGVFLAPNRNIIIDHTVTTGEVISGAQIRIHSAATVVCPKP